MALKGVPTGIATVLSASLLGLFLLPLIALFAFATPGGIFAETRSPEFWSSLEVTVLASLIALAISIVLGVPLGYLLARRIFPGKAWVSSAVTLPVLVPHLVVGLALLLWVMPGTVVGGLLDRAGLAVFDTIWGVILVMVYVGASYTVLASEQAFLAVDRSTVEVVRTLGATPTDAFLDVTLPLSLRGILTGVLLTWARSISEIGGFLILAYTVIPSPPYSGPVTNPAPVYIFNLYQEGALGAAASAAALLLLIALAAFVAVRLLERNGRLPWNRGRVGA
ncbi:MAG: ABC transporter permease [Thermoplasmata archaeon]